MAAFATSYIKTEGSTVTRNADAASMTGANFTSWFNNGEGTVYAEVSRTTLVGSSRILSISDGSTSNFIDFRYGSATNYSGTFEVVVSGTTQASLNIQSISSVGVFAKYSGAYITNSFAGCGDAGSVATDTSGTIPVVSQLNIGARGTGAFPLTGYIRKIAYYPSRLTNAQLQALTS
jgi:hypothetical protein